MPLGYNRVLGDSSKTASMRPHRVALAEWPAATEDPRTATLESFIAHLVSHGYEGIEVSPDFFPRYFPDTSPVVVARKARLALEQAGLEVFGATLHRRDEQLRAHRWLDDLRQSMELILEMGGQFVSLQFFLHDDYLNTGGIYRNDEAYLQWCANRVSQIRKLAWDIGLNFYLEIHVDRITEDPAACCQLLKLARCELNGDMSHYLARGFTRGSDVRTILEHVEHTHVRMARMLGDLSANVEDPQSDWERRGVTWRMFEFMKPALEGGLSSRTISGESGPMHLVSDPLTLDAALVPLYRAMGRYADASAQGIAIKVESPDDLRPWG